MSTTAPDPTAYMIENVTLPAFFAKVASQTGVTPGSAEAATSLRALSDKVAAAVDLYMKKSAAAKQAGDDALIKAAAAATDEALGKKAQAAPQQPHTASASDFLTVPGVRDAALAYVQQKAAAEKAAMAGCAAPAADAVAAAVKPDGDDDEDDKKKAPAAA